MTLFRTALRLTAILASVVFFGATAGFAEDLEEGAPGLRCLAAPVLDADKPGQRHATGEPA